MKLKTLRSTLPTIQPRVAKAQTLSDQRMAGRALQARRMRKWSANPFCANCAKLTAWPNGFELDHKVRLDEGGPDTDENCQILCVEWVEGRKAGCHAEKTKAEGKRNP